MRKENAKERRKISYLKKKRKERAKMTKR